MLDPLYTSEEMKAAEAGHDVPTLMDRAGRAVAQEALRRYPDARSFGAVCGGGANGGDVRIDALFGTGFKGEPRPAAARLIEEVNGTGAPVVAVDLPSGVDADTGEV